MLEVPHTPLPCRAENQRIRYSIKLPYNYHSLTDRQNYGSWCFGRLLEGSEESGAEESLQVEFVVEIGRLDKTHIFPRAVEFKNEFNFLATFVRVYKYRFLILIKLQLLKVEVERLPEFLQSFGDIKHDDAPLFIPMCRLLDMKILKIVAERCTLPLRRKDEFGRSVTMFDCLDKS